MNRGFCLLFIFICCISVAYSGSQRRLITLEEAERLAMTAVPRQMAKLPGFGFDAPYSKMDYYFFDGHWSNPGPGSISAGHYSVDRQTGEVWDAIVCMEYKNRKLTKLQREIRKRIGLAAEEYNRVRRHGLMCPDVRATSN